MRKISEENLAAFDPMTGNICLPSAKHAISINIYSGSINALLSNVEIISLVIMKFLEKNLTSAFCCITLPASTSTLPSQIEPVPAKVLKVIV